MVLVKKNSILIFAAGDNIIIYDTENRKDQHVKIPEPMVLDNVKGQTQSLKGVDKITSVQFSKLGDYFVIATEKKQVIVFDKDLQVQKQIIVNRTPSRVSFTPLNDILVADKTGDVYLYKLNTEEQPILLLGHHSVILDAVISDCGKYIITCDRDEKIRVSCFPNCYNIVSFCLGHREFVTKLNLVENILISASGDGSVRFWKFVKGEELGMINTNKYVDENNLLKKFADQMDKEKVDVTALPITDMQTYKGKVLYIAVSIYTYKYIQLYSTDLLSFKYIYMGKININHCFTFCLNSSYLYVLSNKFLVFNLINENFVQTDELCTDKFYDNYKSMLKPENNSFDVTVLYKRKFDNVKEYLERKKQRLEAK